jgi:hypothetical protein
VISVTAFATAERYLFEVLERVAKPLGRVKAAKEQVVNDEAITSASKASRASKPVEKALQGLADVPVTEACVSGSCDICLYQKDPCSIVGQTWENSHPSSRSGEKKKK